MFRALTATPLAGDGLSRYDGDGATWRAGTVLLHALVGDGDGIDARRLRDSIATGSAAAAAVCAIRFGLCGVVRRL